MIRPAVSIALGIAITAIALWYLLTPDVIGEFRTLAATASWPTLVAATALTAIVQWLRAWRFSIMTNGSLEFPDRTLVRIAFQLNFLNFTLPFRLGELGYPMMMRRAYGHPVTRALGVLLLARLYDLCSVGAIFLALASLLGLGGDAGGSQALGAFAVMAGLALLALVLAARPARHVLDRLPAGSRLAAALAPSLAALGARRAQIGAIALSFAIWLFFGGIAVVAANAVTGAISAPVAMLGAAAGNIAFALPVNGIGGLGASQAAWALAVSWAGAPWEDAVISAFALYAVTLAGALLFGGLATLAGTRSSAA